MRVAVVSKFGSGLSFVMRLIDEGHDVLFFNEGEGLNKIGKGIAPLASGWAHVLDWCKVGAGAGIPTLLWFDSSGAGERADEARKAGLYVVGGSAFCDKMEKDRSFGFKMAERIGATLPPYVEFPDLAQTIEYAKGLGDTEVYWKSDKYLGADGTQGLKDSERAVKYLTRVAAKHGTHFTNMLQLKIEGVAFSTQRWFNGREFVGPVEHTIEHKKFMNDDIGPATGCAFNSVWFQDESDVAEMLGFEQLAAVLRENDAPPGCYDANSIIDEDGQPHFLEWCARCGYDAEPTSLRLVPDLGGFLWYLATGQGAPVLPRTGVIAHTIRLSIPPYPSEAVEPGEKASSIGVGIDGIDGYWDGHFIAYDLMLDEHGHAMATSEGVVGLAYAEGKSLARLNKTVVDYAKDELRIPGLMFRTDADKAIGADAKKLEAAGVEVPQGLLPEEDE
jgi:phosphoribosylamine--glycine ligase